MLVSTPRPPFFRRLLEHEPLPSERHRRRAEYLAAPVACACRLSTRALTELLERVDEAQLRKFFGSGQRRKHVPARNVDLYTATRHYFGWYAWNVLELDARDIALHFGHQDGGELVRKLYGHPDARLARERVREAFRQAPPMPVPLVAAGR